MNRLPPLSAADIAGAADLANPDCAGCVHRGPQQVCRRFPPIFRPATPVQDAHGNPGVQPGGWTFPPAVQRCGEFVRA